MKAWSGTAPPPKLLNPDETKNAIRQLGKDLHMQLGPVLAAVLMKGAVVRGRGSRVLASELKTF